MIINSLIQIIPVNIALALFSPFIFVLSLVALTSQKRNLSRIMALLTSTALAGLIAILISLFFSKISINHHPNLIRAIFDIAIGLVLFAFTIKILFDRKYHIKYKDIDQKTTFNEWFLVSFISEITNFPALFLIFTAVQEAAQNSTSILHEFTTLSVNLIFFTFPALLPLLFYLIFPQTSRRFFIWLNFFLNRYIKAIIVIVFIFFSIIFLVKGLSFFVI